MTGILDYIATIPGARITSTRRDPNSPLGRANPHSYHNIGQAVDVAPIPGMSFGQYVSRLKGQGYNIVEALDEATHPRPHTTGPNWHIAYGQSQTRPSQPLTQEAPPMYGDGPRVPPLDYDFGPPMLPTSPSAPMDEQIGPTSLTSILDAVPNVGMADVQKPKFFGKGGPGISILGIIADGIAQGFGGRPGFAPGVQDQREYNRNLQLYREKVAQEREDRLTTAGLMLERQKALADYNRDNPAPTSLERNIAYLKKLHPGMTDDEAFAIAKQNINRPLVIGNTPYGLEAGGDESGGERTVTAHGVDPETNRPVVLYSDGTADYAD